MNKDLYIIKKYVMAKDIQEALEKEAKEPVQEIYMDNDWKLNKQSKSDKIGFK